MLRCYQPTQDGADFHKKCSLDFFGTPKPPEITYSLDQMDELAKKVVERSVSVPGVQPKLSMSVVKKAKKKNESRLTIVGALGGNYIFKPPTAQYPQMPANEHLTTCIAESYGDRKSVV